MDGANYICLLRKCTFEFVWKPFFLQKRKNFFHFYGYDVNFNGYILIILVKIVLNLLCPTLFWACSFCPPMHDAADVPTQTRSSIQHLRVVLVLWDGAKGSSLVTHLQPQNLGGIFPMKR